MVLPRSRAPAVLALVCAALLPGRAQAVRFGLGVAADLTPLVLDAAHPDAAPAVVLLGFRPILDVELCRYFSAGAYAPFTVYRSSSSGGAATSGAESVFGLSLSGRLPFLSDKPPEEILAYVSARGGFGTADGRAGPFIGGALGFSATWLNTGRGFFVEAAVSRVEITGIERARDVERMSLGLSVGLVFHLGGEAWRLAHPSDGSS